MYRFHPEYCYVHAELFGLPQLVKITFEWISNSVVGLLVMIPYLVGLLAMVLVSRSSDRKMERKYHAAIPAIIAGIAFLVTGRNSFYFSLPSCFFCFARPRHLQRLWPSLFTAWRVSVGIRSGFGDRLG